MLAAVSGRRIFYQEGGSDAYGQLIYYPNLFVCLVGPQGSRKSFAKDVVRDHVALDFPDLPMSASVDTREAITKFMGSDEALRAYTNEDNITIEYRPIYIIINELVNFLSVNPAGMVNFLVDIFDRKYFDVRTKGKGEDRILNPCVNVLACATTEYVADQLRSRILSGGLSRRMVFINETQENKRISRPRIPEGGHEAWERVKAHLQKIRTIVGPYHWADDVAARAYNTWYEGMVLPADALMAGFYRSKHVQVLKITMLLDLASYTPTRKLTEENFATAAGIVDSIEKGMEDLFLCSGRNELAAPQQRLLQLLERHDGMLTEKIILRQDKDLNPMELPMVMNHLKASGRVVKLLYKGQSVIVTEFRYNQMIESGDYKPPTNGRT